MAIIILRSEAAPAGSPFTVPVASDTLPPKDMTVEFGRGNERDLTDVRLQDGVIDAAPAMPLQLIKPLAVSDAAPGAYPPVSWGVQAVGAATCELTGTGITVAILDTGIDKDYEKHPAFEGVKIERKNFTTDPDHDVCGHGTHCAGTVFGRAVDGCRIGVAPCVERALIGKVLGEEGASTDKLVEAILWAFSEGAHVISLSLGMDFPGYRESLKKLYPDELATLATSMALEGYRANVRVFDRLSHFLLDRDRPDGKGSGAVIVAAAGNESKRKENPKFRLTTAPPAAAEGFVSVAAVGQSGDPAKPYAIAPFSNGGARVAGPGVDIWSAKIGGGLRLSSGTSMATPHVAGVAALWAQRLIPQQDGRFDARDVITLMRGQSQLTKGLEARDVGLGLVRAPG